MPRESSVYSLRIVKAELTLTSPPNVYVKIRLPEFEQKTDVIPHSLVPTWNKQFQLFISDPNSVMLLEVKSRRPVVPWGSFLCGTSIEIKELLRRCQLDDDHGADLPLHNMKGNPLGYIRVAIWVPSNLSETAAQAVKDARERTQSLKGGALTSIDSGITEVTDDTSALSGTARALGTVLAKMKIFVNLMDEIAKIHPYTDVAWKVVTVVYKAVQGQTIRDQKVVKLAQTMESIYSFVDTIKEVPGKVEVLEGTITKIFDWTVECANFIGVYMGRNFGGRVAHGNVSDDSGTIDGLVEGLVKLKEEFDRGIGVQNVLLSFGISKGMESIEIEQKLAKLDHAKMDASDRQACLEGTRTEIMDTIENWVMASSNGQNTLWFHGLAGSGKSTISTTVANRYRNLACLGAFIFWDRSFPERSHPSKVIRTLAYQLALYDSRIGITIATAITANPRVTESPIAIQCSQLLVEPLSSFKNSDFEHPIVIVLDALDECGSAKERTAFLDVFVKQLTQLPSIFRFIITSRREDDISRTFTTHLQIGQIELDINSDENYVDISSYLRYRIGDIRKKKQHLSLAPDWPGESSIQSLINRASGLFIWASTACEFIDAYNPAKRLHQLLDTAASSNAEVALDTLYNTALMSAGNWEDEDFGADALDILGVVLTARIPLTSNAIDDFRCLAGSSPSSHTISYFYCVLHTSPTVCVLHPSFADFLTTKKRCELDIWFVDNNEHNRTFAIRCLQFMNAHLERNICHLSLDADVTLPARLSEALTYACTHWIEHLCTITTNIQPVLEQLDRFVNQHILHWIEAMSILGSSRSIVASLDKLLSWITTHEFLQADLTALVDVSRFVQFFAASIEQHPLLVYALALPFVPTQSLVHHAFYTAHQLPTVVGGLRTWPAMLQVLSGHSNVVRSVAFSPDGSRIASCSYDRTVRIWYAKSGAEVLSPLKGHTDEVTSVAFSPDGRRIVSGSGDCTVRVWDAMSGAETLSPLKGHTDSVNSVAFSLDGSQIVSGSDDCTVRVWDVNSSVEVLPSLKGHTGSVTSVAFSPDGNRIVSGSHDDTGRVWDAKTGVEVLPPLEGHTGSVNSIAFSPDGSQIVSGSGDCTVRVWDAKSGAEILSPLQGHTDWVRSVAFSSDGSRIVSGSDDKTVRVWDAKSGIEVLPPFEGHTHWVTSVAFSPDGNQNVSGSNDCTVRVWDAKSGTEVLPPLKGHTDWVTSITFSLDGCRIVSGSRDCTVRVWDAKSGAEVLPPLKGHTHWVRSVAFSPNGSRIVSGSDDCTVRVWDAKSGAEVLPSLEGHVGWVNSVAFSPDGSRIVSGSDDCTVRVWDVKSGAEVLPPLKGRTDWVISVAFSPDGSQIMSRSLLGDVLYWDAATGSAAQARHDSWAEDRGTKYEVLEDGWIMDTIEKRRLYQLPSTIGTVASFPRVCFATFERSVVIGTYAGQVIVVHLPLDPRIHFTDPT